MKFWRRLKTKINGSNATMEYLTGKRGMLIDSCTLAAVQVASALEEGDLPELRAARKRYRAARKLLQECTEPTLEELKKKYGEE